MAFFKHYTGSSNARLLRIERWVWTLIYGGLLCLVLGYFIEKTQAQDASEFFVAGGIAVLVGVVLLYVRSRMREEDAQ